MGEVWSPDTCPCRRCGSPDTEYRVVLSFDWAYEDEQHRCRACGHSWWVDGPDA